MDVHARLYKRFSLKILSKCLKTLNLKLGGYIVNLLNYGYKKIFVISYEKYYCVFSKYD